MSSDAYKLRVGSRLQANFFRLDSTRFVKLKSRLFFTQKIEMKRGFLLNFFFEKIGYNKFLEYFLLMCSTST